MCVRVTDQQQSAEQSHAAYCTEKSRRVPQDTYVSIRIFYFASTEPLRTRPLGGGIEARQDAQQQQTKQIHKQSIERASGPARRAFTALQHRQQHNNQHTFIPPLTAPPAKSMGRGRGKGKRGGRGGGGRQHFVSSLEELESRNDRDEAWAARRKAEREQEEGESGSGEESSSSGGEEGGGAGSGKKKGSSYDDDGGEEEEEEGGGVAAAAEAMEQMKMNKAPPKAKGVSSLIEVANPNAKPKAGRMMKAKVREVEGC